MSPITIENALPRDLPAVGDLYGAVCDFLADKPYNPGWRRDGFPTEENARTYLEAGALLLARSGDVLAGAIGLTASPSAEEGEDAGNFQPPPPVGEALYIHVLAVQPEFHRQGVASRLLQAGEALARQRSVPALRLYVWEGNTVAIRTYGKNGYRILQEGVDIGLAEFGLERFFLYEKTLL